MGEKFQREHPEKPYDLSDPAGIALELAEEAVDDAKAVAEDVGNKVSGSASRMADEVADEARAAYRYPSSYASYTLRRLERRARARPLDTLATAGAIAFLVGAVWAVTRGRETSPPSRRAR